MGEFFSGSEFVLVAQIPKAGSRWRQVHFNKKIMQQFFGRDADSGRPIDLEQVDREGFLHPRRSANVVYSRKNKNYKIEFDFGPTREYPSDGVPLLLVVELEPGVFRYRTLLPSSPGYDQMLQLNADRPPIGRGHRRIIESLDEVEMRWPEARLRNPKTS